ncbi:hypothetical protein FRB99_003784 [Tulasnella sp. 403]|nr:hypothetical protein FRB99_003784 [Tulasnella sp. 403]
MLPTTLLIAVLATPIFCLPTFNNGPYEDPFSGIAEYGSGEPAGRNSNSVPENASPREPQLSQEDLRKLEQIVDRLEAQRESANNKQKADEIERFLQTFHGPYTRRSESLAEVD